MGGRTVQGDQSIEERLNFLRIDDTVRSDLQAVWQSIKGSLPEVLAGFYAHLGNVPALAALVGTRQSRLIAAQSSHWERLFSGEFDADYIASIRRIGLVHHKIGLEPRWYIGGYAFVLTELTRILAAKHKLRPNLLARRQAAMCKVVMLDMDFAISVYQDVLIEERQRRGRCLPRQSASSPLRSRRACASPGRRAAPSRRAPASSTRRRLMRAPLPVA
jgi:hypothetical protein